MNILLSSLCSHLHLKPGHTALLNKRDTSDVWRQFVTWLLVDSDDGVIRFTKPGSLQYHAIQQVAQLYIEDCKDANAWEAAFYAAEAACAACANCAANAAYYAAKAAFYAIYSTAWYAADEADAETACATCAAFDAAWSAYAAADAYAAYYERMANKLIELLQAAPMIK